MSVDALSLACNIITVIDFGHKFYQTFREIYENRVSDPTAAYKANELDRLAGKLKKSRETALQSRSTTDQLFMVADKCVKAAADLHLEITKLIPVASSSRTARSWQLLVSASRRTWRHNRIEELNKAFDDCQVIMQTAVLLQMFESGEAERVTQSDRFAQLESRLQNFIQAISKQDLQISQLLAESRSLHQETRAVIHQEVTDLRNAQISDGQLTRLIASLRFPEMNQRYNELKAAHEKSFKWLLGDSKAIHQSDPRDSNLEREPYRIQGLRNETFGDFKKWLTSEADSKLYWVSGKPGAGKSTLMKYLSRHMENINLVEGPHLVIRHFFWLGTSDARSRLNDMQGMFMTLLHQLLGHKVSGEPLAATLLVQNPRLSEKHTRTDWSLDELEATTQKALEIISRQYLVFILIDALDEHLPESEHGELLDVFQRFEKMINIRLVLSSRRERIFDTRLAPSRQLQLQTLTGPDIYHFSFGYLLKFVDFEKSHSQRFAESLAEEIVKKAEGVFLWARLAVDSLKRGLVDGNSEREIWDRLNDMPTELSDFFRSIWKRLGDDQKRYQVFAANVFSLLMCEANDYRPIYGRDISDLDLLSISLALNPGDARLIIHGETQIEAPYLLKLCQETENTILSHCGGLVELNGRRELRDWSRCTPVTLDFRLLRKNPQFVHRTAREFFQETPEGKRIVDSNDMAPDGPNFRFALGVSARLAAVGGLRNISVAKYALRGDYHMVNLLDLLGDLETASAISSEQRHSLLALAHKLHFRFSDHAHNGLFEDWVIIERIHYILPFVVVAASHGHGDYAVRHMEMQASNGQHVPIDIHGMVLKASLRSFIASSMPPMQHYRDDELRRNSLEKLIHHFQIIRFPSTIYHRRLALTSPSYSRRDCLSIFHLVLNMLFQMAYADESTWRISRGGTAMVIKTALNLAKLLGTSDTGLFQPILCTLYMYKYGWRLYIPIFEKRETPVAPPAKRHDMNLVFEVSPVWLLMHIAQVAAMKQGLDTLYVALVNLVDLQCQNGRDIQRPRSVLLLGIENSKGCNSTLHPLWIGIKAIPKETKGELSEMLVGFLDESSGERHDDFIQRLRELWVDTSIECLQGTKAEESLNAHGLWCSEEEEQNMLKACGILAADGAAFHDE